MNQHMFSILHEARLQSIFPSLDQMITLIITWGTVSVRFQSGLLIHSGYFKQGIEHKD